MAIMFGSARIDETGNITGGVAGDQTGSEVSTQSYYMHSSGWYCLRPKNADQAERIARAMLNACNNNNIGYDQGNRVAVSMVKKYGSTAAIAERCETDCSNLVRACVYEGTGRDVGEFYTGNEASVLEASGLFDSRFSVSSESQLYNGDVLVTKTTGHTVIVVSGRARTGSSSSGGNTSYSGKGIGTATCTDDGVRIRAGAGTNYTILDSVNAGTQVEVLEKTGNWYKIVWPGASVGYAYTCADYYTYSGKSTTPVEETYTQVPGDRAYSENRINYRVHQEKAGWLPHVEDGQTAGITGKALRMEAIKIDCKLAGVKIKAKAHIQKKGTVDYGYITSDTVIGTTGEKLRLEGLELEAEGLPAGMQLYLRYHIQTEGWSEWITGAMAGTAGLGKRLEAIQIKIE